MLELVSVGLLVIFFLTMAGLLFGKIGSQETPAFLSGILLFLIGIFILLGFSLISEKNLNTGSPVTKIAPGTYKVGFVYRAGINVTIGIEKEGETGEVLSTVNGVKKAEKYKTEHLFLYQFPMNDFEGDILPDAHKLVAYKIVTSEGTFNRYKLGYNIVQLQ